VTHPDLFRRVDRLEEDFRAIADTVVDIKETVDQHTATLAKHSAALAELRRDVTGVKGTLADHGQQLGEILALLRQGR
jgi:hypothetical protein